jgi:hypothetical protein
VDLQKIINQTEEYGTIELNFNEYFGQVVIDKPLIIEGNRSTVCAKTGPVVCITSEDVELRNLRIELTTSSETAGEKMLPALSVEEFIRVKIQNVVVKGNVSGIILEDGIWNYPESLHIWPVIPDRKNYFLFQMNVPVSCSLETDIRGLRILNPGLREPGLHEIRVEVNNLKKDTVLFGQIEIKSNYLQRIIAVSGGSFAIPESSAEPDENHPVIIGESPLTKTSEAEPRSTLSGNPLKKNKILLFGSIFFLLTALAGIAFHFFPKTQQDIEKPTGELLLSRKNLKTGESLHFRVKASDNQQLAKMLFRIKEKGMEKSWEPLKTDASYEDSLPTSGWEPGKYTCSLLLTDGAGNTSEEYSDSFVLEKKEIRYGYVNIVTRPYADIYIDGRFVDKTPVRKLKLPEGEIKIRFINKSKGIDVTETMTVEADKTLRKSFDLR